MIDVRLEPVIVVLRIASDWPRGSRWNVRSSRTCPEWHFARARISKARRRSRARESHPFVHLAQGGEGRGDRLDNHGHHSIELRRFAIPGLVRVLAREKVSGVCA